MLMDARTMQTRTLPTGMVFHQPPDTFRVLKFWEIDKMFTCPTVGLCLTFSEQKQILRKVGIAIKKKNAFDIHEMLVASGCSQNRLSRRIDALLARKYASVVKCLVELDLETVMTRWNAAYAKGDYAAIFWAIACRPGIPTENKKAIFGDVHMAMHWSAQQRMGMQKKILRHHEKLADMSAKLKHSLRQVRDLSKENQSLRMREKELVADLAASLKRHSQPQSLSESSETEDMIRSLEADNQQLRERLDVLTGRSVKVENQKIVLERKNKKLSDALKRYTNSNQQIEAELKTILDDLKSMQPCSSACPSFDLCRKRVLVVGGITRMESLYRQLIEGSGGIFEYHDGHLKKGTKQLANRLRRADMVLCPVNCNSHAACSMVKSLAKKLDKPVYMLANGSLNVVTQVIREDRPDKCSINPNVA